MQIAYVSLPGPGANDRFLARVAETLQNSGLRLAGTVQSNLALSGQPRRDMRITVLPDGPLLTITAGRADRAGGCRLDAQALHQAGIRASRALDGADLLIVNKFGKQEAEGRGLVCLIADALDQDIPVLLAVQAANLGALDAFAEGQATRLPADEGAVLDWCLNHAAPTCETGFPTPAPHLEGPLWARSVRSSFGTYPSA